MYDSTIETTRICMKTEALNNIIAICQRCLNGIRENSSLVLVVV